jgi:rsbT co-antagonist protein RsbR
MSVLLSYLNLPLTILVSMLLIYVVVQNPRAVPNRLFGWYMGFSLLLLVCSLLGQTSNNPRLVLLYSAVLGPLQGSISLMLMLLVLALFLPERYAQPPVRWLISLPYLVCIVLLLQSPFTGFWHPFVGISYTSDGRLAPTPAASISPLLAAYVVATFVLIFLTAAIVIRRPKQRRLAGILLIGLLVNLLIISSPFALRYPIIFSLGALPIYLSFAWIIIRYQLFRPTVSIFQGALNRLQDGVILLDDENRVQYANATAQQWLGAEQEEQREFAALLGAAGISVAQQLAGQSQAVQRYMRGGEQPLYLESNEVSIQQHRRTLRLLLLRDITQREQQAQALTAQNEQQRRLLDLVATLETPTITVADGVLLAPIVGALDSQRAQALTGKLLQAVNNQRTRRVILDIAGVGMVDTAVARSLLDTTRALRLLGCEVCVTGISPAVAITMTQLGLTLTGVTTARSPQEALSQ